MLIIVLAINSLFSMDMGHSFFFSVNRQLSSNMTRDEINLPSIAGRFSNGSQGVNSGIYTLFLPVQYRQKP